VLTPQGRVVALDRGATPVDFAYALHTDLGHRCRGAKVNGAMVPLNTVLDNGQRVEIVTAKEGAPSRDWLNPALGYLATHRARSKVRAWFRQRDVGEQSAWGAPRWKRNSSVLAWWTRTRKSSRSGSSLAGWTSSWPRSPR